MAFRIYKNDQFLELQNSFDEIYCNDENIDEFCDKDMMNELRGIFFELSNLCNFHREHKNCPAHHIKKKKVLASDIYYKTIDELSEINYKWVVSYHRYNEPLMDPRLTQFLLYAKRKIPNAYLRIYTNGYYLTKEIIQDLIASGMNWLEVSAYYTSEFERLINLNVDIPYKVLEPKLDKRLNIYDREEVKSNRTCYSIFNDVTVNCRGFLSLCCLDWKNQHILGNLNDTSLAVALNSQQRKKLFSELKSGIRRLDLCKRCTWKR